MYDAYLNFLKNQLIDPAVPSELALSKSDLQDRETNLPDTLTTRNHGDHADDLAQADEGKIVTFVGTLFYAIHSGKNGLWGGSLGAGNQSTEVGSDGHITFYSGVDVKALLK